VFARGIGRPAAIANEIMKTSVNSRRAAVSGGYPPRSLDARTRRIQHFQSIRLEELPLSSQKGAGQVTLLPDQLGELLRRSLPFGGLVELICIRNLSAHLRDLDTEIGRALAYDWVLHNPIALPVCDNRNGGLLGRTYRPGARPENCDFHIGFSGESKAGTGLTRPSPR
jgi:hypothetical protein